MIPDKKKKSKGLFHHTNMYYMDIVLKLLK